MFAKKGECYKPMEKWWLIDSDDVLQPIEEPVIVKVSANRIKYMFPDNLI